MRCLHCRKEIGGSTGYIIVYRADGTCFRLCVMCFLDYIQPLLGGDASGAGIVKPESEAGLDNAGSGV